MLSRPVALVVVSAAAFLLVALLLWNASAGSAEEPTPVMVKDINPGDSSSFPGGMTVANGTIFFQADDGDHGHELWKTDGTGGVPTSSRISSQAPEVAVRAL